MNKATKILTVGLSTGIISLVSASAQITAVNLGTGNPPTTLGGYTMIPDPSPSIQGADYEAYIGSGWATWGQGYTGQVFTSFESSSLVLDLQGVSAVDFYEEPNQFSDFYMTASDNTGASVTTLINGNAGSSGVGFYTTVPGTFVTQIAVTCTDPTGFAIGEFAIDNGGGSVSGVVGATPEPTTIAAFGLGGAALLALRRRK